MAERSLRGSRLGATSYETDFGIELAPREDISYDCPEGHTTVMPFSAEADIPARWECRVCGAVALRRDGDIPAEKAAKHVRTHWDMLLERRTIDDLEVVLQERLDFVRGQRGAPPLRSRKKSA